MHLHLYLLYRAFKLYPYCVVFLTSSWTSPLAGPSHLPKAYQVMTRVEGFLPPPPPTLRSEVAVFNSTCCNRFRVMSEPFANFSCLDELIQIVYQSVYKFVVLSNVSLDHWGVHVGVDGRWWHGRWTQDNLHKLFQVGCILVAVWTRLAKDIL